MNLKLTTSLTVLLSIGVGYVLLTSEEKKIEETVSAAPEKTPQVAAEEAIYRDGKLLSSGISQLKTKPATQNESQVKTTTASNERDSIIWHESEQSKQVLQASGTIPGDVVNEAYVEVDIEELLTVEIGENLDLYIPQLGGSYNGEVDHIQQHPNGDRTVEAFIPGAGTLYSAVITIGEDAIYGNLATQEDVFLLEGIGKYAWIAPKSAMIGSHREHSGHDLTHSHAPSETNSKDVFELETKLSPTNNNN